jgi:hypothetical protein
VIIDTFERASLGANWTASHFSASGACTIAGSSDFSASTAQEMCYWNANTPAATASYACARLSGVGSAGVGGVCLGVDNLGGGNGVCCVALAGGPSPWGLEAIANGVESTGDTAGSPTFGVGDYIGIQRTSATAFRCYRSTNGTTWTALGTGATATAPNPGQWGAIADSVPNTFMLEVWEAGNGTLPTARVCGIP